MPRVIMALLRHGAYDQPEGVPSAHLPQPLTAQGEAQAREASSVLFEMAQAEHWTIDQVVDSSRLLRAWQTATLVARGLQEHSGRMFQVTEFDELAERSLGSAANLSGERIAEVLRHDPRSAPLPEGWQRDSYYRLPLQGAESLMQAGKRVAQHLEARASRLSVRALHDVLKVVVGHGGSFRHAAVHLGVLRPSDVAVLSMAHCQPVYLERRDALTWIHVAGAWKERVHVGVAGD